MPLACMPLAQATCLHRAADLSPYVDNTMCLNEMIRFLPNYASRWTFVMQGAVAGKECAVKL